MPSPADQERVRLRVLAQTLLRFHRRGAQAHIRNLLRKQHPADIALLLGELPDALRVETLQMVGAPSVQADVVSELEPAQAGRILSQLKPEGAVVRLFEAMSTDDAATLLRHFDDDERERILGLMGAEESEGLEGLLDYQPETAGAMMTTEVFSMGEDATVEDAIMSLRLAREAQDAETVFYIYVNNELGQLVGVISLRELVISDSATRLGAVMEREVITVSTDTDREEVARLVEHYNFIAVPVVDAQRHLLGIITVDDVLDVVRAEATEDLLRMSGASDVPERGTPVLARLRGRLAWVLLSAAAAVLVGWTADAVVPVEARSLWTILIPSLLILSLTAAMQSSAVAVGAIAGGHLPVTGVGLYLLRELGAGTAVALAAAGLVAGGLIPLLGMAPTMAVAAALAIGAETSIVLGSGVPLVMHRLGVDPTEISGLLVIWLTAVLSAAGGLGMARLLL